ncbi:MAG: YlbF family regulator [Culicoidibacterales bacterium]
MENNLEGLKVKLVEQIMDIESIKIYLQTKDYYASNRRITDLTRAQKATQKEIVNAQHIEKKGQVKLLEKKLAEITAELEEIPLFQQFKTASEEAQITLSEISELINYELSLVILEGE